MNYEIKKWGEYIYKLNIFKNQNYKDLFATLINQLWRLVSGFVTMLLIPLFLSPEQQGYWFLFGSISALSIFADLGFSNIILQFTAHEYAFLSFNENEELAGDGIHLKKLGSFFRFVIKWLSSICAVVFPIIYVVGIGFFYRDNVLGIYLLPWTIYSIGSLINFFTNSILSFVEGLNKIEKVQNIRFRVALLNTIITAVVLIFHGNIYALSCSMLISSLSIFISIFGTFKKLLSRLILISKDFIYNWKKEILPLFTKYAISSITVFFTLYIYTPIMHYFHGPVYGGKVGFSFTLINSIFAISNIWIYTIIPRLNMYVEKKEWSILDMLFNKRLLFSVITYLIMMFCMILFFILTGLYRIPLFLKITERCFPLWSILLLGLAYFLNIFMNSWGAYLSAHKQVPYFIPSIISSILVFVSTFLIGKYLNPDLFFLGTSIVYIIFWVVEFIIFTKCKKEWHE
jgi:hypothetical protein